ncbi:hypothetical protein BGX26_000481 [Mortierella sp. AD094]|nr:hypothetical protein BGX26_000481 [Mortierella sp. AD094]
MDTADPGMCSDDDIDADPEGIVNPLTGDGKKEVSSQLAGELANGEGITRILWLAVLGCDLLERALGVHDPDAPGESSDSEAKVALKLLLPGPDKLPEDPEERLRVTCGFGWGGPRN